MEAGAGAGTRSVSDSWGPREPRAKMARGVPDPPSASSSSLTCAQRMENLKDFKFGAFQISFRML